MSLDIPALPPTGQSLPQTCAHVWLRHLTVQNIDAHPLGPFQYGFTLLRGMPLHPLSAETDLVDHQAGLA